MKEKKCPYEKPHFSKEQIKDFNNTMKNYESFDALALESCWIKYREGKIVIVNPRAYTYAKQLKQQAMMNRINAEKFNEESLKNLTE